MKYVLLILIGGPTVMVGPPLLAAYLCERHSKRHGRAHAARAQYAVEAAEAERAAQLAADRPKELTR